MNTMYEVILGMKDCDPKRLTPNKVMLCARCIFLLENMRDILPYEYNNILAGSNFAGIIRE